jgi:hypothetical protein
MNDDPGVHILLRAQGSKTEVRDLVLGAGR